MSGVERLERHEPERQREQFHHQVATYVFVSLLAVGLWLIQGADGVITVRHRDIRVGFWPAWPMVIGFLIVARSAWSTFGRSHDD